MKENKEKTLVIIKPDGIQRSLIGEIISRMERVGLKLVALKMFVPNKELIEKHYTLEDNWIEKVGKKTIEAYKSKGLPPKDSDPIKAGERVLEVLMKYMTFGPIIAMVWQGGHAVQITRKLVGGTEPLTSDIGTLRGDFVLDSYQIADIGGRAIRNLIHASSSVEEAEKEIDLWFSKDEILNYRLVQEQILYDVNLDGILE
ncbi:MAG TPA: nucleoside-diphosphate kinase [Candidatus Paceibacterota bacterium]|nr:nucleoside-diphosphate kinase [Candidatus Paceibacterota bacterium]